MRTKNYGPLLTLCALLLLAACGAANMLASQRDGGAFGRDGPQAAPELSDEECGTNLLCLGLRHRTLAANSCEIQVRENVEKDIRQQLVDAGRDAEDDEVGILFPYEDKPVIGGFSTSGTHSLIYKGKALMVKDLTTKGKWQRKKYRCLYDLETRRVVKVSIRKK